MLQTGSYNPFMMFMKNIPLRETIFKMFQINGMTGVTTQKVILILIEQILQINSTTEHRRLLKTIKILSQDTCKEYSYFTPGIHA